MGTRTKECHFDNQHLGIGAGLPEKKRYRCVEGLVRVLQQHRLALADDMEDVRIVQTQLRNVAGLMDGEVQFRPIEFADFHEIPFAH